MDKYKTFNPVNTSSKFAICGLPIRIDSYKTCSFGCRYCFSENREIMKFKKDLQIANISSLEKRLYRIFQKNEVNKDNVLDVLIENGITWHWGGMSDPFQPCESELKITKQLIDITNKYNIHALFSTKADKVYDSNIRPDLHSFQLSITNTSNRKDIEPNVPEFESRYEFYKQLKKEGFKVGIRIQPFIPNISSLDIVKKFHDADHFVIEGIKIVPQNNLSKNFIINQLKIDRDNFTQMGLLNLLPEIRLQYYKPFIEYFEKNNISYSIADNDLRYLTNNKCCCGDSLVKKSTDFNTTSMIAKYGLHYSKYELDNEISKCGINNCKVKHLFTSNRTEGCETVGDFYDKRFFRKSSPFSPMFQYQYERKLNAKNKTDYF